jgi:hypothetical protein
LAKEGLDDCLPNIQNQQGVYGAYQAGKKHKTWIATEVLQFIHADICGPTKTTLLSGAKYFLLVVDDFSRKMWVYLLMLKSDVFNEFKKTNLRRALKFSD